MVLAGAVGGFVGYVTAIAIVAVANRRSDGFVNDKFNKYLGKEEEVDPNDIRHAATKRKRRP